MNNYNFFNDNDVEKSYCNISYVIIQNHAQQDFNVYKVLIHIFMNIYIYHI